MKKRNILCVVGAALGMVAIPCITARAQESYSAKVRAGLKRDVTLNMGRTTIDAVVIALAKKTGLTIQMAKYLRGHKVQCDVEGVSARDVLDAFVQMNHWRWYETTHPGTIALVGKAPGVPRTLTQLPHALRQCMNQDFVRMLMAEPPSEQRIDGLIRSSLEAAIIAHDKISAFVYQHALSTTTHRSISQLSELSDKLLEQLARKYSPVGNSIVVGHKLSPNLIRAGLLGIFSHLFSLNATEGTDYLLCSALPPQFYWLSQTHLLDVGIDPQPDYLIKLSVGHPNGNSYGTSSVLLDTMAPPAPYGR